MGHWP